MPTDPTAALRKHRERDRRRRGVVAVTVEVHQTRADELKALAAQMQEVVMTAQEAAARQCKLMELAAIGAPNGVAGADCDARSRAAYRLVLYFAGSLTMTREDARADAARAWHEVPAVVAEALA